MTDASTGLAVIAGEVARALLGPPNKQLSTRRQWRFGRKGALAVEITGPRRGTWHDHSVGEGGGVLDLVVRERGGSRADAFVWLQQQSFIENTGGDSIPRSEPTETDVSAVHHAVLAPWGHRIWSQSRPITADDPGGRYLLQRGCVLPPRDSDLRFHPALKHRSGHVGPGLVALVTDIMDAGRAINLHRTWIASDGSAKAAIDPPRLTLKDHTTRGGCVRLWPDDVVTYGLGIAEGIETCLTLARVFTPVWSALNAGNLSSFPVLPGIDSITVCVDHDPAGLRAWEALGERWTAAGREARRLLTPDPTTNDLNDWSRA